MEPEELEHLVRLARSGDLRACGRLVEATQAMAYAVARRVLRDPEAAKDAVQETYLRAFRRLDTLEHPAAFPGWLRRVAVTTARSLARARRRCFLDRPPPDVPVLDEQETQWTADQRRALAHALVALGSEDRRLCDRYYHGGWSVARLAEHANTTEPAVRKRLQRLRERLRKEIEMQEQRGTSDEVPPDLPERVLELLARPKLTDLPENPVGGVWERLKGLLPDFTEVEVPEAVPDADVARTFGEDFAAAYAKGIEPIAHRLGEGRFLRPELDVPLLVQLRGRPGPVRAMAAGKVYRDQEPDRAHLQTFHQAELMVVERGLGEWDFMDRLLSIAGALMPGRRLRQEQVSFPLCPRAWEVEAEWEGGWFVVLAWGRYGEPALRALGNDPAAFGAVGVNFGLERIACLHYGVDDVRKVGAAGGTPWPA